MRHQTRCATIVLCLLLTVGAVPAAFEFDTTCTTCANEGDVGPFIELGFSAYALASADDFPADLWDQALLDRFEVLQAETRAVLLRSSRVTVSQGRVVEFTIDRPGSVAADSYPSVTAVLAPMLLEDGSIQVNVEVTTTRDAGAVTGPQGEAVPITASELLRTMPVMADGGTIAVPVTVRLNPTGEDAVPSVLHLALLMSPSVVGDVPAAANGEEVPVVQVALQLAKVADLQGLNAVVQEGQMRARLAALVSSGKATIINEPRIGVPSGTSATASCYLTGGIADLAQTIETLLTITPTVLADGQIELSCEMATSDQGVELYQAGQAPQTVRLRSTISFGATVADGETLLIDLGPSSTDGERSLLLFTARIVE